MACVTDVLCESAASVVYLYRRYWFVPGVLLPRRIDWPLVYGRCPVVTGGLDVLLREQIWLIRPR